MLRRLSAFMGQHPAGALRPGSEGAVTLKAFACSRALAFYRPSIGWSKLGLAVGGRSGDAVWLRRLLRRSEPLGAQPSFHLHYDAPRSEQTRSRPSAASIEAPLHSASVTQIGPLETTTQTRGLAFASPMGVRTRHITNNSSHKRFQTLYAYLEYRSLWPLLTSPTDATPTNRNGTAVDTPTGQEQLAARHLASAGARGAASRKRPSSASCCLLTRPPTEAPLQSSVLWRTVVDAKNVLAVHRSLRPCARKVHQGLFFLFGLGFAGPTHGFLGILPELLSLRHCHPPDNAP
jgi:hypothetical protein